MQGKGQGDFSFLIVGGVVEHTHRLMSFGQGIQRLQPAGLQRLGLQCRFEPLAVFVLHRNLDRAVQVAQHRRGVELFDLVLGPADG
ncbi:hypothetical protein D3C87_1981480 [compost metagenome]